MCELARPTDNMPETRYVKGETRYMKIQKPGRAVDDARTLVGGGFGQCGFPKSVS